MDKTLTYSSLGALTVAAAAFGFHVGESAIAQINPLYFQGAALHPRDRGVVVDEAAFVESGPRFAQLYGWEEGADARTADCVNCEALDARDAYAGGSQVSFAVLETGWSAEARPASLSSAPEDELTPRAEEPTPFEQSRAQIARYAYEGGALPKTETAEAEVEAEPAEAEVEGL